MKKESVLMTRNVFANLAKRMNAVFSCKKAHETNNQEFESIGCPVLDCEYYDTKWCPKLNKEE